MNDGVDDLHVEERRRVWPSLVWLVPLLAIAIALGVAWQNYSNQGPLIEVSFEDASGVHAGDTELRYRDIVVGVVETVEFAGALDRISVSIRLDQEIERFVDEEASFWVVRPEVTTQGVSGLDTVLSGVYIEGDWDGDAGFPQQSYEGLERAPLLRGNQGGTIIVLQSPTGLPPASTPILYRGVTVGQIGTPEISEDGQIVTAQAAIYAPHNRLLSSATRFWDISGVSFNIGAGGASLDFSSLASLIAGGVTFETLESGGSTIPNNTRFELFADEETARQRFLIEGETGGVDIQVVFEENLPGLAAGAGVMLGGVRLGEVTSIAGVTDEARFGDGRVRLSATLRLVPSRVGFTSEDEDGEDFLDFLDERIQAGLRAQLANASLLTRGLRIEFVIDETAPPAGLDRASEPFPQIPSISPNVTDVTASAQGLLQRVEDLPVEGVFEGVIAFLNASTALVQSEDLQAAPADLRAALSSIRAVAESEEIAALPEELLSLTESLTTASDQLGTLLTEVETAGLVANLSSAVADFATTAETLPGLSEQASGILSDAEALSLDELAARVTNLVTTTEEVLAQDSTRALPAEINGALAEMRGALAELRAGGLIDNANEALGSAREAAEALALATESLPALSDQLVALAREADVALGDYTRDGQIGRELSTALRQIEAAADSIDRLARQISRNPNSIITGR